MLRLDIPGPAANETKYLPKENDTVLPHMIMTESQADHMIKVVQAHFRLGEYKITRNYCEYRPVHNIIMAQRRTQPVRT